MDKYKYRNTLDRDEINEMLNDCLVESNDVNSFKECLKTILLSLYVDGFGNTQQTYKQTTVDSAMNMGLDEVKSLDDIVDLLYEKISSSHIEKESYQNIFFMVLPDVLIIDDFAYVSMKALENKKLKETIKKQIIKLITS